MLRHFGRQPFASGVLQRSLRNRPGSDRSGEPRWSFAILVVDWTALTIWGGDELLIVISQTIKDCATNPRPEKPGGECWLVSAEQQLLCQFIPDSATVHAQWVALR